MRVIKKQLTKRTLDMLSEMAKKTVPEGEDKRSDYELFWESFGKYLKLGIVEDQANRRAQAADPGLLAPVCILLLGHTACVRSVAAVVSVTGLKLAIWPAQSPRQVWLIGSSVQAHPGQPAAREDQQVRRRPGVAARLREEHEGGPEGHLLHRRRQRGCCGCLTLRGAAAEA